MRVFRSELNKHTSHNKEFTLIREDFVKDDG